MATLRTRAAFALSAAGAIVVAAAVAGCASLEVDGAFEGLQSLTAPQAADNPARVFVIHGMIRHENNYADGLAQSLGDRLGFKSAGIEDAPVSVPDPVAPGGVVSLNLRTYYFSDGAQERLRIGALNWSPLTAAIKDRQFYDDDQVQRAAINGLIKTQLLNEGLSDAVLFLGDFQPTMRAGVMAGLCAFLEGDLKGEFCAAARRSTAPIAFISESLGSYMLLDAIEHLNNTPRAKAESAAGFDMLARLRVVYMFANQIPLLGLSELDRLKAIAVGRQTSKSLGARAPAAKTRLGKFFELVRQARARAGVRARTARQPVAPTPPFQFVAFTDSNDLLSYAIRASDVPSSPDFAPPANVRSPNAVAWFDLFADPVAAHNNYSSNPQALELVVCGTKGCAKADAR